MPEPPADSATVVLLHAFPLDGRMFDGLRAHLDGAATLAIDLPGFGGSREAPASSIDEMADHVARALEAREIARAVVLGVSMGGYVALALAERHPARVAGLVLVDTRAGADDAAGKEAREATLARLAQGGVAAVVDALLPRLLAPSASQAVRDEVRAWGLSQSAEAVGAAVRAMRDRPDRTALLPKLTIPVTAIVGEDDVITPEAVMRDLVLRTPGATLDVVRGAGHLAPVEAPRLVADVVRRKLAPRPTHLAASGEAHMVGVGAKAPGRRVAVAGASVHMRPETLAAIADGGLPKGDAFGTARIAGIMAAKRTPDLVPLCHPVALSRVEVAFECEESGVVHIRATAECVDRTGVEMEAMVAASVAAITLYDMIKSIDRWAVVADVRLLEKQGGKSGRVVRP